MWRRRLKTALVVASITVVMMVLVGEVGLRIIGFDAQPLYQNDPRIGWTLRPDVTTRWDEEGSALVATNSAGMRDVEHTVEKPANVYRIAVLGDSFAEALQVERDQTFWARLEEELASCPSRRGRKIEVLNFGVSSYGTANELLILRDRVFGYSPDLVVTSFFTGNDLQDNHPRLDHLTVPVRPYFRPAGDGLTLELGKPIGAARTAWAGTLRISRIAQLVERIRKRRAQRERSTTAPHQAPGGPRELFGVETTADWDEAWLVTERLLRMMSDDIRAHRARFLLVAIANDMAVNPDDAARDTFARSMGTSDLFYADHRIGEIAQRAGIDYLALGPPMLEEARKTKTCPHGFANALPCAGHWNVDGHRVAGRLLAQKICASWASEQEARNP